MLWSLDASGLGFFPEDPRERPRSRVGVEDLGASREFVEREAVGALPLGYSMSTRPDDRSTATTLPTSNDSGTGPHARLSHE